MFLCILWKWISIWPLFCLARKALKCSERWICSCWLVPWMLIFVVNIKCTPSVFISGRVFGKWNDDLCPSYSGSSLGFFWELLYMAEVEKQLEKCSVEDFTAASSVVLNKEESKERSYGLGMFNCATSRNTISAEVWWMMLQKKEALSNLKGQDWTNLSSGNEVKTL